MKAKKTSKKSKARDIIIRVESQPTPTVKDLVEPIHEGKKYAITPTWVSTNQIMRMVQRTPREHIYTRPGKGGQKFTYVTGNYVEKVLNYVFGFMWDFEVVAHGKEQNFIWVQGKLTVKNAKGDSITKTQFGRAEIKYLKNSKDMLDFGNDLKAATTDALKKCASLLGIASDVYGKQEFKQEAGIEIKEESINLENAVKDPDGEMVFLCAIGDEPVTPQEAEFSKKIYGKVLCREHQTEAKRKK